MIITKQIRLTKTLKGTWDTLLFLVPEEFDNVELESNIHNAILNEQSKELEYLYKKD